MICKKFTLFLFSLLLAAGLFSLHAETLEERALFYARHTERAFEEAEALQSKLPDALFDVAGMSGKKTRHFLNNLCSLKGAKYLEIGVWKGSTFLAALYGNSEAIETATAIENWSQFGSPKREFWEAVDRFLPDAPFTMLEKDAFAKKAPQKVQGPITVYFYDGPHEERDHELAFTHYDSALDEVFIAVVDDWNWERVRNGTRRAFEKLGYRVFYEKELFTGWNGDAEGWWNGLYIAVVQKNLSH